LLIQLAVVVIARSPSPGALVQSTLLGVQARRLTHPPNTRRSGSPAASRCGDFGEGTSNFLSVTDLTVGLDLHYTGGNRGDIVLLNGLTVIGRNFTANLGTQIPGLGDAAWWWTRARA
jgi:hypothetical protein